MIDPLVALCAFALGGLAAMSGPYLRARWRAPATAEAVEGPDAQPRPDPCHMLKPSVLPAALPQVKPIGTGPPPGGWRYSNNFVELPSASVSFRPDDP